MYWITRTTLIKMSELSHYNSISVSQECYNHLTYIHRARINARAYHHNLVDCLNRSLT